MGSVVIGKARRSTGMLLRGTGCLARIRKLNGECLRVACVLGNDPVAPLPRKNRSKPVSTKGPRVTVIIPGRRVKILIGRSVRVIKDHTVYPPEFHSAGTDKECISIAAGDPKHVASQRNAVS
jgi:hypothetical protein